MRIQTIHKPEAIPADRPPSPVTPYSLTLLLAYLHNYTPERLPRGHFIAPNHLRLMAEWIGLPAPGLRSIRQHRFLAAHFALLQAAGFIAPTGTRLIPLPAITTWLHASPTDQFHHLLAALQDNPGWQQTCSHLGLEGVLTEDLTLYLQQLLTRQLAALSLEETGVAQWLTDSTADSITASTTDVWLLDLPVTLPLWLHFDLRQLGGWSPENPLVCTPLSIATATHRGYGQTAMQWITVA